MRALLTNNLQRGALVESSTSAGGGGGGGGGEGGGGGVRGVTQLQRGLRVPRGRDDDTGGRGE